jgi:hypothetical protein
MELWKTVVGKIAGGAVALGVIAAAISWWRLDEATRAGVWSGVGNGLTWLAIVAIAPWATFFVIGWVARQDSNAAGAMLVVAYTFIEVMVLLWLFGWTMHHATGWAMWLVGVLTAAVYNLLTCDWIAEKV